MADQPNAAGGDLQQKYRQFLDLMPLTLALAGLPPSENRLFPRITSRPARLPSRPPTRLPATPCGNAWAGRERDSDRSRSPAPIRPRGADAPTRREPIRMAVAGWAAGQCSGGPRQLRANHFPRHVTATATLAKGHSRNDEASRARAAPAPGQIDRSGPRRTWRTASCPQRNRLCDARGFGRNPRGDDRDDAPA